MPAPQVAIDGEFAFRFAGHSMDENATPYHLVGVGLVRFSPDGRIGGRHRSTITALDGFGSELQHTEFDLSGIYTFDGRWGAAEITFSAPIQVLMGTFEFVPAGADRFWLISSGAKLMQSHGRDLDPPGKANEVVSGEAVKIG